MSTDPRLRAKLFEVYSRHYERINVGGSLADISDPTKIPKHHLRMWDRTYGHLVRQLPPGARVLDLGCGTGLFLFWLMRFSNAVPVGVDISWSMVSLARQSFPELEIYCSEAVTFLRERAASFGGIFCFHVLEHLLDNELFELMTVVCQSLVPGGFFCAEVPNASHLIGTYHRYNDLTHVRAFTRESLLQLFESVGLVNCSVVALKAGRMLTAVRQSLEYMLHKFLFLLSGCVNENVFTPAVAVVGFKPAD